MPKPCQHRDDLREPGCRVCELYATDPAYRRIWDEPSAECRYFGIAVRRPGQVRDWHECDHPDWPLGELVCKCKGCGPKCRGYMPADSPPGD